MLMSIYISKIMTHSWCIKYLLCMDLLLSSLTSMLFYILVHLYKKALQSCGERGFLQVYFTCTTHYNNWKKRQFTTKSENSRLPSLHHNNNRAGGVFKCLNRQCSKPQPDAILTSQAVLLITPAHFPLEKNSEAKGRKGTPPPQASE